MVEVKEQVERIIEEGKGSRRNVIVQMAPNEETREELLKIVAEVHRQRNLCLTARDLLPARQDQMEKLRPTASGRLTPSARSVLSDTEASLAAQVGAALPSMDYQALKTVSVDLINTLLENVLVQKSLGEAAARMAKKGQPEAEYTVPQFWSSKSVVLDIGKDDLAKLLKEDLPIRDVYPNRTLRIPRLVETKSLPLQIQEERASSWGVHRVGALSSWGAYGARGKGVRVAVLDTGVDADHPDLKGKVMAWAEFNADGYEVVGSQPHDTDQHGTHCAGTIVGGRESGRWIGVAPEAELAVALVLNKGTGSDAQILAGIDWAINQNVDVISMSLGGLTLDVEAPDPYTEGLLSALVLGIPVVTAIGNDGSQTTGSPGNDWFAFSVGATDHLDRPAGFSGGRTHMVRKSKYLDPDVLPLVYSKPELSAPGVAIRSCVPGGKWMAFNGTSMATPHVAGAVALLLSATTIRERIPTSQRAFLLQDLLTGSVEELGESGQDHRYGFGRVDVLRAIGFAKERGY